MKTTWPNVIDWRNNLLPNYRDPVAARYRFERSGGEFIQAIPGPPDVSRSDRLYFQAIGAKVELNIALVRLCLGAERAALEAAQNPTVGPFLRGLVDLIGIGPAKKALQQRLPARSPIQDAMNQAGAIRMGVREIPQVPGQAPKPEGFGGFRPVPNPPTSKVPLQQGPVRMEPGFTRGGSQGVQLQPGAIEPRAAELFEVDNQLRIPYNQPGKGGQAYSPLKSAENPEVAGAMMRSRLGDVADAADFPRFRGAEGQRALDLEPSVTREMMQRMAPAMAQAPRVPDPTDDESSNRSSHYGCHRYRSFCCGHGPHAA